MKKKTIIGLILCIIISSNCYSCPIEISYLKDKSGYVLLPAIAGFAICGGIGWVVGVPFGVFTLPICIKKTYFRDAFFKGSEWLGCGFGLFGYYVLGAPFYLTKKIFYDFPQKLFSKKRKSSLEKNQEIKSEKVNPIEPKKTPIESS